MAKKAPGNTSIYSEHPAMAMERAMLGRLADKTGKTLKQWIAAIEVAGLEDVKTARGWLKEQGLTTNYAWTVAEHAFDKAGYTPEACVEAQYAYKKAELRPIYERLLELGFTLGDDVRVCPCKTMVPFYRNHVFAEVKPATQKRIDFGLALKNAKGKLPKRILPTGGIEEGDRITHRIALESPDEIDAFVEKWLRAAYDLDE